MLRGIGREERYGGWSDGRFGDRQAWRSFITTIQTKTRFPQTTYLGRFRGRAPSSQLARNDTGEPFAQSWDSRRCGLRSRFT